MLSARSGNETVYIDRAEGGESVSGLRTAIGTRLPIGIGAGGVALLAAMPPEAADAAIEANATRYRRYGRHAPALLRTRIAEARTRGFALTESLLRPGVWAIGVVVPSPQPAPDFAIGVASRQSGEDILRFAPNLSHIARELSVVLLDPRSG